jgi:hypothetical protein
LKLKRPLRDEFARDEPVVLLTGYEKAARFASEAVCADIDNMQSSEEDTEPWRVRADIQF